MISSIPSQKISLNLIKSYQNQNQNQNQNHHHSNYHYHNHYHLNHLKSSSSNFNFTFNKRQEEEHRGDGTYYTPGLGACGQENQSQDFIVAVSHSLYDSYGANDGGDSRSNPICGKLIRASYGSNSIDIRVVDRCSACQEDDLDLSPSAFQSLASMDQGRLEGLEWYFL